MSCCVILEKIVYRLPGTKRPVYGVVLGENEDGSSLLFVKRPNGAQSHLLAIGVQTGNGYYEDARTSQFPLDKSGIAGIGLRLRAIAESFDEAEVERMLQDLL